MSDPPSSHLDLKQPSCAPAAVNSLRLFPVRSVSVTTWRSSLPAVARRRRTDGAPGRSWPGTAADSCGAVRKWSRASLTACSRSTAAWCTSASPPSASRTPEMSVSRIRRRPEGSAPSPTSWTPEDHDQSSRSRMPEEDGACVLTVQDDHVIQHVSWKAALV